MTAVREVGDAGVTSHAVAKITSIADSHTPRMLKALADRGLVVGRRHTVTVPKALRDWEAAATSRSLLSVLPGRPWCQRRARPKKSGPAEWDGVSVARR